MRKLILVVLGLVALQSFGQESIISGNAPEYSGAKVIALRTLDFISNKREVVEIAQIGDNGSFELHIDLNRLERIDLQIEGVNSSLLMSPGVNYEIFFPSLPIIKARTFSDSHVDIELLNLAKDDINVRIAEFNGRYERFFGENYFELVKRISAGNTKYMNSRAEQLAKTDMANKSTEEVSENETVVRDDAFLKQVADFKKSVNDDYRYIYELDTYFKDYVTYAIALLELQGGKLRAELYGTYLRNNAPLTENSEYMVFLDVFYKDIFGEMARDFSTNIYKTINVKRNFTYMDSVLQAESYLSNKALRRLVMVKGLKEAYRSGGFDNSAVTQILEEMSLSPLSEVNEIASNTLSIMGRGTKRFQLEDFKMLDNNDKFVSLSDYKGQFVYVGFFASWCQSCVDEVQLLEKFHIKYGNKMKFISISMDDNYSDFQYYLGDHQNQKWTFLYGPSDPLVRDIFDLHSVSEYFLIDPDGKLVYPYTKKPSEGVNIDIDKLVIRKKPTNKGNGRIKVWDD